MKGYRGLPQNHSLLKNLCADGELHSIVEKVKKGSKYWLGIRDNKVMIYYLGGKISEISANGSISISNGYLKKEKYKNVKHKNLSLEEFEEIEEILKEEISEIQSTRHNEKITQQEIMINNNKTKEAEWFLVDMEYSVTGIRYGRFDMIALSKEKDETGKYRIALIELKSGTNAFGGVSAVRDDRNEIVGIRNYGSGIAGHINNFYEFLCGKKSSYTIKNLAKEIVTIIENYNEIGIVTPFKNVTESEINTDIKSVECIILCTDIKKDKKEEAYRKARRYIFKNEHGASKLCLESDFCWNTDGQFCQKYNNLKLYISVVDKERVIKRADFRELKK